MCYCMYTREHHDSPPTNLMQFNVLVEGKDERNPGRSQPCNGFAHHQNYNEGRVKVQTLTTSPRDCNLWTLHTQKSSFNEIKISISYTCVRTPALYLIAASVNRKRFTSTNAVIHDTHARLLSKYRRDIQWGRQCLMPVLWGSLKCWEAGGFSQLAALMVRFSTTPGCLLSSSCSSSNEMVPLQSESVFSNRALVSSSNFCSVNRRLLSFMHERKTVLSSSKSMTPFPACE